MEEYENVEETTNVVDESKFESAGDDSVIKVDLSKPIQEENADTEQSTDEVSVRDESEASEEVREENVEEQVEESTGEEEQAVQDETAVLEEVTDEEPTEELKQLVDEVEEAVAEAKEVGVELPENIQKLLDFMEETGGSLEDYVELNRDYSDLDNLTALTEYYKRTKPHLTAEEINFLIEDSFNYDEEVDDERDIKKKKIALKEQVASAKSHLDGLKSKYYDEIKAGVKLTPDQKKAVDFFNRYNKEQEVSQKDHEHKTSIFNKETNKVFNQNFKGFEYKVGDKRYRFNVKDADKVKSTQSDITNFVKKFLNDKNEMSDANGYHKSLFTAMNADAIANHFYEQGRADAIKDSIAKAKNVSMDPRQTHKTVEAGGMKVRAITGDDSNAFRVKIRK